MTVKSNDVPIGCYSTYTISAGGVMCVLGCFACSVGVCLGLCFSFFLDLCDCRMINGMLVWFSFTFWFCYWGCLCTTCP